MEVKIIRTFKDFESLKDGWNKALEKSLCNVFFLRHEWLSNWWRSFGADNELFVILVTENGSIAAAAPLMILKRSCAGVLNIKKLQFIAHEVSDYMDFMICGDRDECFALIMKQIQAHRHLWDWAEFLYIPEISGALDMWKKKRSGRFKALLEKRDVSVVVDISNIGTFDGYLRSLNKKVRQDIVRQRNNIEKLGDLKLDIYKEPDDIRHLMDGFFRLHRQKWGQLKLPSKFEKQEIRETYLSLIKELEGTGLMELSVLRCGGDIVAMHYGFVYNGRYYWYTPTYNRDYQKYSPGKLLLAGLVESAVNNGIGVFDLLRGDEKYKYYWSDREIALFAVMFINLRLSSRIKYFILVQIKRALLRSSVGGVLKKAKHSIARIFKKGG